MKTRNDFVSNSSSCSFVVGLHSNDDITAFKRLFNELMSKNVSMEVYDGAENIGYHANGYMLNECAINDKDALSANCYVLCDVGEDHDSWYEERYNAMCDVFDNSGYAFKFYEDPWAHMTRGEKLPKE